MALFSFIMPVKNEEKYIQEAIQSVIRQAFCDWELIVVDDQSTDGTLAIVSDMMRRDPRIRLVFNPTAGLFRALNLGYRQTSGRFIKFVDGDDVLDSSFSNYLKSLKPGEAFYHDLKIVNERLENKNDLRLSAKFVNMPFPRFFKSIAPIPRGAWIISREIADRIFPLPEGFNFPHGDVWIALSIKKFAKINYLSSPVYLYRQHPGQFYSGTYNFERSVVIRRAQSMSRIISYIRSQGQFLWNDIPEGLEILRSSEQYYHLLGKDRLKFKEVLQARLTIPQKVKLLTIRNWPGFTSFLSRWKSRFRF